MHVFLFVGMYMSVQVPLKTTGMRSPGAGTVRHQVYILGIELQFSERIARS